MTASDRLYQLLPTVYRMRDAEQGEPLRALLGIISDELAEVEADITGLYENWFIETGDEWVVPYIGDLLGVRGLNNLQNTSFSQRAYVANTIHYRRRKGTAYVLELLAHDVTGWPAQAVEFFELLQTTQYLNHLRLFNTRPDLRDTNRLNLLDTPFDSLPHTADLRHIYNRRGKHNIPNIGLFLWRLQSYPLQDVKARRADAPNAHGYHFSPLGNPAPLFNFPALPGSGPDEQLVPGPIRLLDFNRDLNANIKIKAEQYTDRSSNAVSSVAITDAGDLSKTGLQTAPGEWTSYAGIDLTGQTNVEFRYSNNAAATGLEVRLGSSTGRLLGTCDLPPTTGPNDFKNATCRIAAVSGAQTLVLVYPAGCQIRLNWFNLGKDAPDSRYYGPQRSLQIVRDGLSVPPRDVMCKNLSTWARPPAGKVAVDVLRGRITFAAGEEPTSDVLVSYNYGFSADIGGGPYDRQERILEVQLPVVEFPVGAGKTHATLAAALAAWNVSKPPAVIRIYDSATYDANLTVNLPADGSLVIDCENEERPTLVNASPLTVTSAAATPEEVAAFTLSGLVIEGSLDVSGKVDVTIGDCTLVPGIALDEDGIPEHPDRASLVVSGTDLVDTSVTISRSILGPIQMPELCKALVIRDSIVDAPLAAGADDPARAAIAANAAGTGPGPALTVERSTVFGETHVRQIDLGSESIFVNSVKADRRQVGCLRFSYAPVGSQTPRRYRCQPDLALETRAKELDPAPLPAAEYDRIVRRVRPQFTRLRYGEPAYAQLSTPCADEIKTGAEDGSEMGAFCLLQQPQRVANLQIALDEYLRFGLEAGIFFVT
jgi:hypothetical protein